MALDRLSGVLASCHNRGGCWRDAGITVERVKNRNRAIEEGSAALWRYADALIDEALRQGFIGAEEREAMASCA